MHYADHFVLIDDLFIRFKENPESVDPTWRAFFEGVEFGEGAKTSSLASNEMRIHHLITAYRTFGHVLARVNPVAKGEAFVPYDLQLETLGFSPSELKDLFPTLGLLEKELAPLEKIIEVLHSIYCQTIGIEYMHLPWVDVKTWLQEKIEPTRFRPEFSLEKKKSILEQLNKSTLFETFLHTKYVGQKRFSLEGGETLIPILNEIVESGSEMGMTEFVIGMPHRGRLNVLSNILKKSYSMIFSEFEGYYHPELGEEGGDVKYHKGFSSSFKTVFGKEVHISLTSNPSHLESVDAVVEGKVYAKQVMKGDVDKNKILPILIHGDASIAGQGVVYETLQCYKLDGYSTGGTVHIIINNQIGFTTLPEDSRSTFYCTNIARGFLAPIFHVNAEDPEGCVFATKLALAIRQKYHCDVFIDMYCYRKYGHNEGDEPFFTQPLEYAEIRNKKSIREIYLDTLMQEGLVTKEMADSWDHDFKNELHKELEEIKVSKEAYPEEAFGSVWGDYHKATLQDLFTPVNTAVAKETLEKVTQEFSHVPEGFNLHPKVERVVHERQQMLQNNKIDWGMGEHLAFATLLNEGVHVRLAGQDCRRGTFSQRHAMWVDQKNGNKYFPLKQVGARFDVIDSPLSEYAALAFEYGYSGVYPSALILWEAQFGDFSNGAQIVIDQYIVSGEYKWARYSGLVLLLPHGYEGQGPEHSSARAERFLQLCGAGNIQVTYPTTPAQYFHLLRRQVLRTIRKPLIVLTPKGLLRHPQCVSALEEFTTGTFREFLADDSKRAKRVLLCTGRIYYDLLQEKTKNKRDDIALVRIEQLYPLLPEKLKEVIDSYTDAKEIFWVQEEPRNMGAWNYLYPILHGILPKNTLFNCVSRKRAATTATGSHEVHKKEHEEILKMAFG